MHPLMAQNIANNVEALQRWSSSAEVYLPGGSAPGVGDVFVQADLGRTLQYMADQEAAAARSGREAGLKAARDASTAATSREPSSAITRTMADT